jgi:DNA mismatch endonuclease (patch repair protein)
LQEIISEQKASEHHRVSNTRFYMIRRRLSDPLPPSERSALMAKVSSTGNRSTEVRVEQLLVKRGISGWTKHSKAIPGRPDFFFEDARLAVFVHGCFWHNCKTCDRNMPRSRHEFWINKIQGNERRDRRVLRRLQRAGFRTLTIWEHSLKSERWINRLTAALSQCSMDVRNVPQRRVLPVRSA